MKEEKVTHQKASRSESGAILPMVIILMLALTLTGIAFLNEFGHRTRGKDRNIVRMRLNGRKDLTRMRFPGYGTFNNEVRLLVPVLR